MCKAGHLPDLTQQDQKLVGFQDTVQVYQHPFSSKCTSFIFANGDSDCRCYLRSIEITSRKKFYSHYVSLAKQSRLAPQEKQFLESFAGENYIEIGHEGKACYNKMYDGVTDKKEICSILLYHQILLFRGM